MFDVCFKGCLVHVVLVIVHVHVVVSTYSIRLFITTCLIICSFREQLLVMLIVMMERIKSLHLRKRREESMLILFII